MIPPPACSFFFVLNVPPSKYVRLSELTPPPCNVYEFSNEKSGSKKREKN